MKDSFWHQGMMAGHKNVYECTLTWNEDYTDDLKRFNVPTLIIHGEDDQIVPIDATAHAAAKIISNVTLKVYPGGPHGLPDTHKKQLTADLLAFLKM
jgi:non-heme chloroperoxidase